MQRCSWVTWLAQGRADHYLYEHLKHCQICVLESQSPSRLKWHREPNIFAPSRKFFSQYHVEKNSRNYRAQSNLEWLAYEAKSFPQPSRRPLGQDWQRTRRTSFGSFTWGRNFINALWRHHKRTFIPIEVLLKCFLLDSQSKRGNREWHRFLQHLASMQGVFCRKNLQITG